MSNLLKSKLFLGAAIATVMFGGVVAIATPALGADCTITHTLKVGSKGAEVKCLQTNLGVSPATGTFGTPQSCPVR